MHNSKVFAMLVGSVVPSVLLIEHRDKFITKTGNHSKAIVTKARTVQVVQYVIIWN